MTNKSWTLTPAHTLTLAPPNKRGICLKCSLEKEIVMISARWTNGNLFWEERKFCRSCTLDNLYELEENDYKVENKKQVIKEIRSILNTSIAGGKIREILNNQPVIDKDDTEIQISEINY